MKIKSVDLGKLAARKNFSPFGDHPYTEEEDVPYFDFRSSKGKAEYEVTGSDASEVVVLNWFDDLANLGGGDDVGVGAYGNDTLNGEGGNDFLFGDTDLGLSGGTGDNDVLNGGAGNDLLVGDAPNLWNGSTGGADTLAGGEGDDTLWGDGELFHDSAGGADEFIYIGGHDVIMDFRQDDGDEIDVSALAGAFGDLLPLLSSDGTDTVIDFGANDTLTLAGFGDHTLLGEDDFIFV